MAHLLHIQLERFQLEPETYDLAMSLLHTAKLRTAPGSGHELSQGAAALPAICAYIACNQLNSLEVDLITAQTASCTRSLLFKKTLAIVTSVLEIGSSSTASTTKDASSSQSSARTAYTNLLRTHKFRKNTDVLLASLMDVEDALLTSGELMNNELKELKNSKLLRCAVFGWTCNAFKAQKVTREVMRETHDLEADAYDDLIRVIDSACSQLVDNILKQRAHMQKQENRTGSSSTLPTPTPSPTKSRHSSLPTKSPTKSVLKRTSSTFTSVEQPTPTKRKVAFAGANDEDDYTDIRGGVTDTPSKKARLTLPTPAASTSSSPSRSDGFSTPTASSSRVTLDRVEEVDEPMEVDASLSQTQTQPILPLNYVSSTSPLPVTPRHRRQSSSPTKNTPTPKSKSLYSAFIDAQDLNGSVRQTRWRPTYLDHKQWFSKDPKIEREIKKGEEIKAKLKELYGAPKIERYRLVTIE